MSELKNMTGKRIGRLNVVRRAENNRHGRAMWECLCDCGRTKIILGVTLRNGRAKSCGCYRSNLNTTRLTKHGMANSPEYAVWMSMRQRCVNPNNKEYKNYGGRGIIVCDEWDNFENWKIKEPD